MANTEPKVEDIPVDVVVQINTLRRDLGPKIKPVKEYNVLLLTTGESLRRQKLALEAFRSGAQSIIGWDFVGDLPVKVVAELDAVLVEVTNLQSDMAMCGALLQGCDTYIAWFTSNTMMFNSAQAYVSYLQQLTQAHSVVMPNVDQAEKTFQTVTSQAKTNALACDHANQTISEFIKNAAKRSAVLVHDKDIEYISQGRDLCNKVLDSINTWMGEPICKQCVAGINLLIHLLSEGAEEGMIQYKMSQLKAEEAFAKLGPYDIASARAQDTMRIVDIFLNTFDTIIPYFNYIKMPLRVVADTYLQSSVLRAKQLDKEKSSPETFFREFKDGLVDEFKKAAKELMEEIKKYADEAEKAINSNEALELPEDFITKTVEIVVTAFAQQVVARMPIEPAQQHPGVELSNYVAQLKSSYTAGLQSMSPGIKEKIEAIQW
jgi:hypothetical protein